MAMPGSKHSVNGFLRPKEEMILKSFCGSKAYRMIKSMRSQGAILKEWTGNNIRPKIIHLFLK
jgi:hypothetical protein